MVELEIRHQIKYTTKQPVPIPEMVEALLGLEQIIKRSPAVLEELFPETHICDVRVFVESLESGSLTEDILVKFLFGSQEEFDAFIEKARKRCRMDIIKENKALFSAIIIALILGGVIYAVKKSGAEAQKIVQIEANNNTIINLGAGMVELSPQEFRAIIETVVKADTKLAKDAIHIIKPAKNEDATVEFDGNKETMITSNTVASTPSYLYQEDEAAEHFEDLNDVSLEIRAMDLDRKRQGWAAVVPSVSDERARLQIDAVIDLESLKGMTQLKGDVTLIWLMAEDGSKTLKRIILRELKEAKE